MHDFPGAGRIDRLIAIRSFGPYANLPLEDVEAIVRLTVEREYRAGELMMREGEPIDEAFFVLRGLVQVRKNGVTIRNFGPRSMVGGAAAVSRDAAGYECVAVEDTIVLAIRVEDLLESLEEHFEIVRQVLAGMTQQILEYRRALGPDAGFVQSDWAPQTPAPSPMNLVERVALLRGALPFAGSRLEALADLAKETEEVRVSAGESLWEEGDLAESFVFVIWGAMTCDNASGFHVRFGPGDVAGFLGAFSGARRWFSARAETDLVGLRLSTESLLDVFEDHSELAMAMVRTMATSLLAVMNERAAQQRFLGEGSDDAASIDSVRALEGLRER